VSAKHGTTHTGTFGPKRFYDAARHEPGERGWTIRLDDHLLKTPARQAMVVPTAALAQALAEEWNAQGERIAPRTMPLNRLANTALDRVSGREETLIDELMSFAGSDLVCYRAQWPRPLAALQAEAWDPLLDWLAQAFGARLDVVAGIMPHDQPASALDALRREAGRHDAFALTGLHNLTTLTGSFVLALCVRHGRLSVQAAWDQAHIDEDWNISQWGQDAESAQRRATRWSEMKAAADLLRLLAAEAV
jgi:chaperone required for assembly of F1-ATPase